MDIPVLVKVILGSLIFKNTSQSITSITILWKLDFLQRFLLSHIFSFIFRNTHIVHLVTKVNKVFKIKLTT